MKKYTVAEAALILIRNGVIRRDSSINKNGNGNSKFSTGEPQVRLWIREYSKAFDLEYNKQISWGENSEKAQSFAHTKASKYGIKASMENRKIGYRILEDDLFEFITYKLGYKTENKLISKLNSLKQTKSFEIRETKGNDYGDGFEEGVRFALNFFEKSLLESKSGNKEIIHLPKNGWFIDKNSIVAENYIFNHLKNSTMLNVDFKNKQIKQIHFSLRIINYLHDYDSNKEIIIDWGIEDAILPGHYRASLEKIIVDVNNIRLIKDILIEQIPQDNENRLAILLLLSE